MENQKEVAGFSPEATEFLLDYDWPGNVRKLGNAIERATILAEAGLVTIADLPHENMSPARLTVPGKNLKEVEKSHILNVLCETGGSHSGAARILEITRMTLYNKARGYGRGVKRIDNV